MPTEESMDVEIVPVAWIIHGSAGINCRQASYFGRKGFPELDLGEQLVDSTGHLFGYHANVTSMPPWVRYVLEGVKGLASIESNVHFVLC